MMKRISELIEDIQKHPFKGIGKPEPLKGEQHGLWSRRITDEHRIVYSISSGMIYVYVISLRYHYSKWHAACLYGYVSLPWSYLADSLQLWSL